MKTRAFVVGTAGHVDHGKSTLVTRLTGIDPDRLQEEKDRELTIDLGFAWLELPGGQSISIVDVPGHERFIKNMLAGVGGIDAVLFVVAADEGPMPQTREHLSILDLLEIESGVIALTKRDLVDDEWLDLVIEETREVVAGTILESAPIVPVSSTTGEGCDELLHQLERVITTVGEKQGRGRARLPVDRVFSVTGFGTVVTGTLAGSSLSLGDEVELLPSGRRGRVRGLQTHGEAIETAVPGSRVAVNVTGIDRDQAQRGDVLSVPGWLRPSAMIDARIRMAATAPRALEQNDPVDLFVGSAERAAQVTLLDADAIEPGDSGWVQIRVPEPVAVAEGDLFILRQASPSLTIGGGRVVNAHPKRHRRFRPEVISELETRLSGTPADLLAQRVAESPATLAEVARYLELDDDSARGAASEAIASGHVRVVGAPTTGEPTPEAPLMDVDQYSRHAAGIVEAVSGYHEQYPLRRGMPREAVRSQSRLEGRWFDRIIQSLAGEGRVVAVDDVLALPAFRISLNAEQSDRAGRFIQALASSAYSPPSPDEFGLDRELLGVLESQGDIVSIGGNVVFGRAVIDRIEAETLEIIDRDGSITLAGFRDHFNTSRKYAQAVLEYFDEQRVTRRTGDERVRGSG